MERKIYFITGNKLKFQIAQEAFKNSGFKLVQKNLETPEIQSKDLGEIASYSAQWAVKKLKHPLFLTDAGCFIKALNNFPGPFIKWSNQYLSAQDYLNLMKGKKNRKVTFTDCVAYCEPNKKPVLFFSSATGKISLKRGKPGKTSINEIFIPHGFDRTESEIPHQQVVAFWNTMKKYPKLIKYLKKLYSLK